MWVKLVVGVFEFCWSQIRESHLSKLGLVYHSPWLYWWPSLVDVLLVKCKLGQFEGCKLIFSFLTVWWSNTRFGGEAQTPEQTGSSIYHSQWLHWRHSLCCLVGCELGQFEADTHNLLVLYPELEFSFRPFLKTVCEPWFFYRPAQKSPFPICTL